MNLVDEYQNFLIFIALIIAVDEGWAIKLLASPQWGPSLKSEVYYK